MKSYADLKNMKVGVKRKTAYFKMFDKDTSIRRCESLDDEKLAKMFEAGRFETLIVLDKPAIENVLKEQNIGYAWADYKVPLKLEVYFGLAKTSKHAAVAGPLSEALKKMVRSGRIAEIYIKFGVKPLSEM